MATNPAAHRKHLAVKKIITIMPYITLTGSVSEPGDILIEVKKQVITIKQHFACQNVSPELKVRSCRWRRLNVNQSSGI